MLALQWGQLQHDEIYHKDIVRLPVGDRLRHMTLHIAKYLGVIVEALETRDDMRIGATLVDMFIIDLASANALNMDLGREVAAGRTQTFDNLVELGIAIATELGRPDDDDGMSLIRRIAHHSGRLAKACESLDHLEAFPFREVLRDNVLGLFKVVVAEASLRQINLVERSSARLRAVESANIFDDLYRAGRT
jgi:hypothetical protein